MSLPRLVMLFRKILLLAGVVSLLLAGGIYPHAGELASKAHVHEPVDLASVGAQHAHLGDEPDVPAPLNALHCDSKILALAGLSFCLTGKTRQINPARQIAALNNLLLHPDPPPPRSLV
ncbi:MAG: hypothetical protein JKY99_04745 [Rhizobiales bacterium]|nr:hypothetical protein [Hyphomicrobiales bacterium]